MNSLTAKIMAMLVSLSALHSRAQEGTPDKSTYLMCKNQNVVRTIRVEKTVSGNCTTTYTKDGVDAVVSKSMLEDRCIQVLGNIRNNLEKANWKCKDISQTRVSSSVE